MKQPNGVTTDPTTARFRQVRPVDGPFGTTRIAVVTDQPKRVFTLGRADAHQLLADLGDLLRTLPPDPEPDF